MSREVCEFCNNASVMNIHSGVYADGTPAVGAKWCEICGTIVFGEYEGEFRDSETPRVAKVAKQFANQILKPVEV